MRKSYRTREPGENSPLSPYVQLTRRDPASGLTSGAVAGIVVGIVAGLTFLSLAVWLFFIKRRRATRRYSTDLAGGAESDDSHVALMRPYSAGHNPMIVEPFRDRPEDSNASGVVTTRADRSEKAGGRKGAGPRVHVNRPERPGGDAQSGPASASRYGAQLTLESLLTGLVRIDQM